MRRITLRGADVGAGTLILVNPSHPLRAEPDRTSLAAAPGGDARVLLHRTAAVQLAAAMALLRCQSRIVPVSGYRSLGEQKSLYARSLEENGPEFTRSFVALPGCSEHQTGLAIDLGENRPQIDFIRPAFPDTGICQAFRKNAARFGFILRYPAGRESVTRIAQEPWHFRYVGYPHSRLMQEAGLTLEEYTEELKRFPYEGTPLRIVWKSARFRLFYAPVPAGGSLEVQVPDAAEPQVSGNNDDGFVVAWEER